MYSTFLIVSAVALKGKCIISKQIPEASELSGETCLTKCAAALCLALLANYVWHCESSCSGAAAADWDETLQDLWQQLQHRTGSLTGKQVQDNSEEATAPSCSLLVSYLSAVVDDMHAARQICQQFTVATHM